MFQYPYCYCGFTVFARFSVFSFLYCFSGFTVFKVSYWYRAFPQRNAKKTPETDFSPRRSNWHLSGSNLRPPGQRPGVLPLSRLVSRELYNARIPGQIAMHAKPHPPMSTNGRGWLKKLYIVACVAFFSFYAW